MWFVLCFTKDASKTRKTKSPDRRVRLYVTIRALLSFLGFKSKMQVAVGSRSVWDEINRLVIEVQTLSSNDLQRSIFGLKLFFLFFRKIYVMVYVLNVVEVFQCVNESLEFCKVIARQGDFVLGYHFYLRFKEVKSLFL